jgi:hypothetical protein
MYQSNKDSIHISEKIKLACIHNNFKIIALYNFIIM